MQGLPAGVPQTLKFLGTACLWILAGNSCDIIRIVKLDDSRQSTFLIQDMLPVTDEST